MRFWSSFYSLITCVTALITACLAANENPSLCFPKEDFFNENAQIKAGDELFEAALYSKAINAYQEFLYTESDPTLLIQTRFRLAQALLLSENPEAALAQLEKNIQLEPMNLTLEQEIIRKHSLYLKGIILKDLNEYSQSKEVFLSYTHSPIPPSLTFYDEAIFEIGLLDFLQGNDLQATKTLESLNIKKIKPRLYILSNLYLARIALRQKDFSDAAKTLGDLTSKLTDNDPLFFELNYLQGEAAFGLHDYKNAIFFFNNAIPSIHSLKSKWQTDALYQLGWSYLKLGNEAINNTTQREQFLKNAENAFSILFLQIPTEKAALALAQCYLSQANLSKKTEFFDKAEELLSKDLYISKEGKAQAWLLRAEAAPSYVQRDQFYRLITEGTDCPSIFFAKGWYMRGLNDFEYGRTLHQENNLDSAKISFEQAIISLKKSFQLLKDQDFQKAGAALKYQALATAYISDAEAMLVLETLINEHPLVWKEMPNKDEIYYLHGYFAARLSQQKNKEKNLAIAEHSLQTAAIFPETTFGDQALNYLAALHYKNENYKKAEEIYLQLIQTFPDSSLAAEAMLWSAYCADKLQKDAKVGQERRRYTYEKFPNSPAAAEAFFTYYTYPDYLQGDRQAIKHLQSFNENYRDSLFLIDAHYLIGLDYKRDRKTPEGRWIRKKSLTDAIDSFQKVELLFEELAEKKLISEDKLDYYTAMRYRATLERAIINLKIAEEAQGAKKQIYLDYAEGVFKNLANELKDKANPFVKRLFKESDNPVIEEENAFWMAHTYVKGGKDEQADHIFSEVIEKYKQTPSAKGYFLARAFEEKGLIALRQLDYGKALILLKKAEEASKGNLFSTDQRLELLIQQSICYRGLGQYDDAILVLSKAINDDAISGFRIKAMYLRAEIYELQHRPELARKQLESMVKKGGYWAKKAQEKLDKEEFTYAN
jgi:tetratricopeptide (TPR) repeat protein